MRKYLLATAALLALTGAANAAIISDLGLDPNLSVGRNPGAGFFDDQYLFELGPAPKYLTLASITNGFPGGIGSGQFIQNFTGSVIYLGANGVVGGGDDQVVIGPVAATLGCQSQTLCQALAGSAILAQGNYLLDLNGTAGGIQAAYGGTLNTLAVPGPRAGSFTIGGLFEAVDELFKSKKKACKPYGDEPQMCG